MNEPAISVRGVGKAYRLWESPAARLTAPILETAARILPPAPAAGLRGHAARRYRDFWALKGVSFDVGKGESVGIVGRNGSGKSTLLQIIAGTLQPTEGSVRVNGRVAALLELGSGFNPDFTGRENVYLNAAVLGLSRREVDQRFDAIAAFADIGDFIEQPVKTYSNGMLMRLAFAVQTAAEPDILIVDEALAVGDAQFVAKCINYIAAFIRSGRTLLFVSHEVGLVKQLTTRALHLDRGHPMTYGTTPETVLCYLNSLAETSAPHPADPERYTREDAPFAIEEVAFEPAATGRDGPSLAPGVPARLIVRLVANHPGPAQLVLSIYNYMGIIVCSNQVELPPVAAGCRSLTAAFTLPRVRLAPGKYRVNFSVRNGIEIVAWARNALYFDVSGSTTETFIYREDIETCFTPNTRP